MKTRQTTLLSPLICALLLSGCGQTGPLYLPEADTAPAAASPQEQPQEPPETDVKPAPDV